MPFDSTEVRAAYENFIRVGDSGDWSAWVEHSLGTFVGREAIRTAIIDVMASAPRSMYFPVEFAMFEGDRIVYYPWQCLPDPAGGDEVYRFGCVTILTYGGDGQFSYQEDVYNPAEGNAVFRRWIKAGGVMPRPPG